MDLTTPKKQLSQMTDKEFEKWVKDPIKLWFKDNEELFRCSAAFKIQVIRHSKNGKKIYCRVVQNLKTGRVMKKRYTLFTDDQYIKGYTKLEAHLNSPADGPKFIYEYCGRNYEKSGALQSTWYLDIKQHVPSIQEQAALKLLDKRLEGLRDFYKQQHEEKKYATQ